MPFIPHTKQDIEAMLKTIGVDHFEALFDEIQGHCDVGEHTGRYDSMELAA